MNKEIQILYSIFELELSPPFVVVKNLRFNSTPDIYNKHWEEIGWFELTDRTFGPSDGKDVDILNKVKQVFNVDKLSDDDVYHINKHLFNWLQNKFAEKIEIVAIQNPDTLHFVKYRIKEQ